MKGWEIMRTLVFAAALGVLVAGCEGTKKKDARPKGPTAVAVRAAPVTVGAITLASEHPGEIFAEAVEVAPRQPGRLLSVNVGLGDTVKKGQVVAQLDDVELLHQSQEAAAAAAAARANARRAEVQLELAKTELSRKEPLAKDALVSEQEMSEVRSRVSALEAEVAAANASARQSASRAQLLEEQRKDLRLVAPFDSVVAERKLDPGAAVGPSTPILRLVASDQLRVRFRAPESALSILQVGLPLEVRTAASGERSFEGRVERIGGEISRTDRAVQVEGVLTEASPMLKPGAYATVRLKEERLEEALLVPSAAIVSRLREGKEVSAVFVAEQERARMVPVTVLGREGDRTAVRADELSAGVNVLTLGHEELSDGSPVRVVEVTGAPQTSEAGATR